MKYSFKDIYNDNVYNTARVVFILGKYSVFNNIVCDKLKSLCTVTLDTDMSDNSIAKEFGMESDDGSSEEITSSVDFNTFMDVIGVANILGRWYCRTELTTMTKKQKEKLFKYIREPSDNGLMVIVSDNWQDYKDILKIKVLGFSMYSHIIQLGFPNRNILKDIVRDKFNKSKIAVTDQALDLFVIKMSAAYEEYDKMISEICTSHKDTNLNIADMKVYLKGVEHYILEDFVHELLKPLTSEKANRKKVIKIMVYLEEEYGAKNLVYRLLNIIDESIEFRLLINRGCIPIGLNYFYKDVINNCGGEDSKYGKMNEWVFRKKALLASETSIRDWEYMKLILRRAVDNVKVSDEIMNIRCKQALYEVCVRSVLTESRLNNIINVENVMNKRIEDLNKIVYGERKCE